MADLNDYQKKIEASLGDISKLTYNIELFAAQEARVQLELRTFATGGSGVKNVNGGNLSPYSKAYAQRRIKAGLQADKKDLIFSKDSSVIKDNITVGLSNQKPALGFLKKEGAEIAGYQEEREKVKIFETTPAEREKVAEAVKEYMMKEIGKIFDSWR